MNHESRRGARDTEVPLSQPYLIRGAAGTAVRDSWIVPDAGHTQACSPHPEEYTARIITFFNGALP